MARAHRLHGGGGIFHITHRCHNRAFLLKFARDRDAYRHLLREALQQFEVCVLDYCLTSNHVHLLIERQADAIGRIMHRVLTGYSQYYNRRYRKLGHVLQGRHNAILCQSDRYLSELARYIHLNSRHTGRRWSVPLGLLAVY